MSFRPYIISATPIIGDRPWRRKVPTTDNYRQTRNKEYMMLLHSTNAPSTNYQCPSFFVYPYAWSVHVVELLIAALSLVLNICATVLTHSAVPISIAQRKVLAWISMNYTILGGFQLARNIFMLFSLYDPCVLPTNTINCKLQQFPLLYCYLQAALLTVILSLQTFQPLREDRQLLTWASSTSIWLSIIAAACIATTLLFTAFDRDYKGSDIGQCSVLVAIKERKLGFWLITVLIALHASAVIMLCISACLHFAENTLQTLLALSLKEVVTVETFIWELSFLLSGTFAVHQYVATYMCVQCVYIALEISFITLPLTNSFIHPLLIVWNVLPLREAAVRLFPSLASVVPEYTFVPPSLPSAIHITPNAVTDICLRNGFQKPHILTTVQTNCTQHCTLSQSASSEPCKV